MSLAFGNIGCSGASSGGGSGTGQTLAWASVQHAQSANFASGDIIINLGQTPLEGDAVSAYYNGVLLEPSAYSITGQNLTILFADPYVTSYDNQPKFQINFPYTV